MNTKTLIATVAMIAATGSASVFAQQTAWADPAANFVSTKTRAEVSSELKQAQAKGAYVTGGAETQELVRQLAQNRHSAPQRATAEGKTRAEVHQELTRVQADGNYMVGGEAFPGQAQFATRAVRAHANAADFASNANPKSGVSGSWPVPSG